MISRIIGLFTKFPELFASSALTTLELSLLSVLLSTVFGTLLAFMKISKRRPLRWIASAYIEIIRGTPSLLQFTIILLGLPAIGIPVKEIPGSIAALTINSSAYVAEIIRSGINSVDNGQMEAARSLGMPGGMAMMRIVLPQAVKNILPSLGNEFVMLIKESSMASIVFTGELMTAQKIITGVNFMVFEPLIAIAIIYFIMTFTLGRIMGVAERRMRQSD